jgi:hypothetical protein
VKVDQRSLEGIDAKLRRADWLLRDLYEEMRDWDSRKPFRLLYEVHNGGRKHFWRLKILDPMPVMWSVTFAEALHDLRSALEHCVYWLGIDWTGKPVPGCSFPVYTSKGRFYHRTKKGAWAPDSGMWKIRGVGPGPQKFIEALQPYPQRRAFYCRDVRTIHDLWNQDKHRLVQPWGLRFAGQTVQVSPQVHADCSFTIDRRVLQDNSIVLRAKCQSPHAQIRIHGEGRVDLVMQSGKRKGGGQESFWDTALTVSDVAGKLMYAIGRQDRLIDMTIWSEKYGL